MVETVESVVPVTQRNEAFFVWVDLTEKFLEERRGQVKTVQ